MILAAPTHIDDERWRQIGEYLKSSSARLVREPLRNALAAEWGHIEELEQRLDDALRIGLIGGTGVGKSMLINALAGAEISRSDDRRPTTDRVVAYLHRESDLGARIPEWDLAMPLVTHRRDLLKKVILLDFPDFDSAETSHAEILQRFLPHLDVLLVIVDDMKYGDLRLYEVLRGLPQDVRNLFVVLNKFDRLAARYGARAGDVAEEILADIRQNMEHHAQTQLPDHHQFYLSAVNAFRLHQHGSRDGAAAPSSQVSAGGGYVDPNDHDWTPLGQFDDLRTMIESYQQDKRRRLAKENNIDARRCHVMACLARDGLSSTNATMLAELEKLVHASRQRLDDILRSIPTAVFGDRERNRWRNRRLRLAASKWSSPVSLLLTMVAESARWRGTTSDPQTKLTSKIERHYRSYFDAASNLKNRFDAELASDDSSTSKRDARAIADDHRRSVWRAALARAVDPLVADPKDSRATAASQARPGGRRKLITHLPAVLVGLGLVLSQLALGGDHGWVSWLWRFIGVFHPWFLLNLATAVLITYILTTAVIWLRETQRMDADVIAAEAAIRDAVGERGDTELQQLSDRLALLSREHALLKEITET